ncbi:hypothetical protein [Sorangium sp. So ce1000]
MKTGARTRDAGPGTIHDDVDRMSDDGYTKHGAAATKGPPAPRRIP